MISALIFASIFLNFVSSLKSFLGFGIVCVFLADDQTYISGDECLEEYVMGEMGIIYYGSANYPLARYWFFGQVGIFVLSEKVESLTD